MSISGHQHPTPRAAPHRILEDASGRRLQRMRWVGRAVALLFLAWLVIVILGGLGVGPAGRIPLGNVLHASSGPPPVRHVPKPAAPAKADLVPALPAPTATPATANTPVRGKSATRPRSSIPGKSATAPGQAKKNAATTTTSRGRSASAPGHTTTTPARGNSGTAPGHLRRTTTTTTTPTTTTAATVPGRGPGHGKKP